MVKLVFKNIEKNEINTSSIQRRSLRFKKSFNKNHVISEEDLFPTRPISKNGIPPYLLKDLIGKKLNKSVEKDTEVEFKFFNND